MSRSERRGAIRQEITESYSSGEQAPPAHGRAHTDTHAHMGTCAHEPRTHGLLEVHGPGMRGKQANRYPKPSE